MKAIFNKLAKILLKNVKLNIVFVLLLSIILGAGLSKIELKMGNDVFVDSKDKISTDTAKYQEAFGGDSIYLLLEGKRADLLSRYNTKELKDLTDEIGHVTNVKGTTNHIDLINEMMTRNTGETTVSKSVQEAMLESLSAEDKKAIANYQQKLLTNKQQKKLQNYTLSLLTEKQQMELMRPGAKADLSKQLTKAQQQKIQHYSESLLSDNQKLKMQHYMSSKLPKFEEMDQSLKKALLLDENGHVNKDMENLFPEDGRYNIVVINTGSQSDMDTAVKMTEGIKEAIANSDFKNVKVEMGGAMAVQGDMKAATMNTMSKMLLLAVAFMVVTLMIVFPVRRRILSLVFVLFGLLWTFGLMGWLGIPVTFATMATLPIIIGLGTDFGVQLHNRYEEEIKRGISVREAIINTVTHTGSAVFIAVFIMALSFLTMYLSKAPLMQDFGLILSMGVVLSFIAELLLMVSCFYMLDRRKEQQGKRIYKARIKGKETFISKLLTRYVSHVRKFAVPLLILAVLVSGWGFYKEHEIPIETDFMKMVPDDLAPVQSTQKLQQIVGSTSYLTYLVEAEDVTDKDVLQYIKANTQKIDKQYKAITETTDIASLVNKQQSIEKMTQEEINQQIDSLPTALKNTSIDAQHQYAAIQFKIDSDVSTAEQYDLMKEIEKSFTKQNGITVNPAGSSTLMVQGVENVNANHYLKIIAGLAIIFTGLLLVYRNLKHALFPLIPIALVIGFSPLGLMALGISYNSLTTALSCLILGIGTEFTILIMERYREELETGIGKQEALKNALSNVGQAITASGLTVIVGFTVLKFANFPVLADFGVTTVIDTALALLAAIFILPALIMLFDQPEQKDSDKSPSPVHY